MSSQNIFDNEIFFKEYQALRSTDTNFNDLLEQPAMAELLPNLREKAVLDLGCGCGHNCLAFANSSARSVTGIDLSEKMLQVAQRESADAKIQYLHMNMTDVAALNQQFDFIYSSLAFHYVEDFVSFIRDIYASLHRGGQLLFSQEHPLVTATIGGGQYYNYDGEGRPVSFTFSNYNQPGRRSTFWYEDGVEKYHRTFSSIKNTLAGAGFIIETIAEPLPSPYALKKRPSLVQEEIKPTFLIVKARKP